VEDVYLGTERDEGKHWPRDVPCVGRRKDGVTSCGVKEQGTGGTNGWEKNFTSIDPEIGIRKTASNRIKDM
jgi:hypothetical protein